MIEIKEYIISLLKKTRSKVIVSSFSDVTLKNDSILIETKKELNRVKKLSKSSDAIRYFLSLFHQKQFKNRSICQLL